MAGTIMVTGCAGSVGHGIMNYLSVTHGVERIVGVDVNGTAGSRVVDEAILASNFMGFHPKIEFRSINLLDVDGNAEILKDVNPVVICHTATLGSWWITHLLPPDICAKVIPLGPWVPNQVILTLNLMQAVKRAGVDTRVINGCYPDLSNVILGKLGIAPTCGSGNMDHACNYIKFVVSKEMNVPMGSISVYGVGHYGAFGTANMGEPYYVKILVGGQDVSDRFPHSKLKEMVRTANLRGSFHSQIKGPPPEQARTSASFARSALDIYFGTGNVRMSVPAPNGLPGGYPCRLDSTGAEIVLPEDLTLPDAVRINEEGAKHDGIERVKDDGTVIFLDENVKRMNEVLGYQCKELKVSELKQRSDELNDKLKKCYEKYAVK